MAKLDGLPPFGVLRTVVPPTVILYLSKNNKCLNQTAERYCLNSATAFVRFICMHTYGSCGVLPRAHKLQPTKKPTHISTCRCKVVLQASHLEKMAVAHYEYKALSASRTVSGG
jgi:hypothetical protein